MVRHGGIKGKVYRFRSAVEQFSQERNMKFFLNIQKPTVKVWAAVTKQIHVIAGKM